MRLRIILLLFITITIVFLVSLLFISTVMKKRSKQDREISVDPSKADPSKVVELPKPRTEGDMSLEEAIITRRSVREYKDEPLGLDELSQILWAAQGVTSPEGYRTAPSAGALYPIELYVAVGNVNGVSAGVYKYDPDRHVLIEISDKDVRDELYEASLMQEPVRDGAAVLVMAGVYERTTIKYSERGIKYVHIEVGHVGQNIYLQATSLGVGTVYIGAFDDGKVKEVLGMEQDEEPLGIMPLGNKW